MCGHHPCGCLLLFGPPTSQMQMCAIISLFGLFVWSPAWLQEKQRLPPSLCWLVWGPTDFGARQSCLVAPLPRHIVLGRTPGCSNAFHQCMLPDTCGGHVCCCDSSTVRTFFVCEGNHNTDSTPPTTGTCHGACAPWSGQDGGVPSALVCIRVLSTPSMQN